MLLRHLRYFITVVEEKSFTEAAEKHFVSQSAVSQTIGALEREIGVALFTRKGRSFTLTASGAYLYGRAKRILADLDNALQETQRLEKGAERELCVAYLNEYAGPELLDTVAEFSAAYPEISVSTFSGTHEEIYHGLLSGSVSLALSDQRRAFNDDYVNIELVRAECMAEIAQRRLERQTDLFEINSLPQMPCILIAAPEFGAAEAAFCRDVLGFSGDFLFAKDLTEARLMVTGGRGFLLVEALGTLPPPARGVLRLPLFHGERPLTRRYCLFWQKARTTHYIEAFAGLLQKKLTGGTTG